MQYVPHKEHYASNTKTNWFVSKVLKPTDTWCTNRFDIQKLYILPTLYLRVLYLSKNK